MTWYEIAEAVIAAALLVFLVVMIVSPAARARTRVLLQKRLFAYKYDYRREWLRFIGTLSVSGEEQVHATAIRAVAQIVNSPGGALWVKREDGDSYEPIGSWKCDVSDLGSVDEDSSLIRFLQDQQWIIDLNELDKHPARYTTLDPASFFPQRDPWWLIVPMFLGNRLFGFIMLLKPPVLVKLNFEDHDLLKTVGRQVATHIDQAEADRRLAEAKQFGAYNRLTAFLMHDLNNLIAQQSLVVKNAERFRDNPEFVDDTIKTISHSVDRMRRLMAQLKSGSTTPPALRRTDLHSCLRDAVERCRTLKPLPTLKVGDGAIAVEADPERLTTVFEHLIRNAQDATPDGGTIVVEAGIDGELARVSVADTGEGMTPAFIRDRLFRPFDSTKGSERMGIGAYQARDYVRSLKGQLDVSSQVGAGTTFVVRLPVRE
jgi:putative PEP-CTERM system histidine kinase